MRFVFAIQLITVLLMFRPAVSQSCDIANWWRSLDRQGWSVCPKTNTYLRGFWRSEVKWLLRDERVGRLEEGKCCEADAPIYATQPATCSNAKDWKLTLDGYNVWALCPYGFYLNGLRLGRGPPAFLSDIDEGRCCRPQNHPNSYEDCYDEDVTSSFDNKGWSECQRAGYYMTGFYKSNCNQLYCIETFRCCQMIKEDATLSDWSPFTNCSVPCGRGFKIRYRSCVRSRFGGKDCASLGPLTEQQPCNVQNCSEDATLSDWSPFTNCSVPCGRGFKIRYRTCIRSRFGGKDCASLGALTEQQSCNVQNCSGSGDTDDKASEEKESKGMTFMDIFIVSAGGSVFFLVVTLLAAVLFKIHKGRKSNTLDGENEEEITPYVTVHNSGSFVPNAENNARGLPGMNDNPMQAMTFQPRTPLEERATDRRDLPKSPYENIDHLGRSSVNPLEYLLFQPRYENEAVDNETRDVVMIRPGYAKLGTHPGGRLPCGMVDKHGLPVYDSLIRRIDPMFKSQRVDITDSEREDDMNIDTKEPSCRKMNEGNTLGDIEVGCIGNDWKTSEAQGEVQQPLTFKESTGNLSPRSQAAFKMEDQTADLTQGAEQ